MSVEDVQVGGQQTAVEIDPTTTSPLVTLDSVAIRNNCAEGVDVAPGAGQTAKVLLRNTTISQSGTGVAAFGTSHTYLLGSSIFGNTAGISAFGGGAIIDADAYTQITANGTNGVPNNTFNGGPAGRPARTARRVPRERRARRARPVRPDRPGLRGRRGRRRSSSWWRCVRCR